MLRRFNYTGRHRIEQSRVAVCLVPAEDGPPSFDISIDLSGINLPQDARVFVEAYDKSSYMRFDYGTVADPCPPVDRRLLDIQSRDGVAFRVKVVDEYRKHGRVLAIADSLLPARIEGVALDRESLLWSRFVDLGDEVWRLDLSGSWAFIELNEDLKTAGIHELLRDNIFFSLVLPSIVREILTNIIFVQEFVDADGDDWRSRWLAYAESLGGNMPELPEDRKRWIDQDVVGAVCRKLQAKEKFIVAQSEKEK